MAAHNRPWINSWKFKKFSEPLEPALRILRAFKALRPLRTLRARALIEPIEFLEPCRLYSPLALKPWKPLVIISFSAFCISQFYLNQCKKVKQKENESLLQPFLGGYLEKMKWHAEPHFFCYAARGLQRSKARMYNDKIDILTPRLFLGPIFVNLAQHWNRLKEFFKQF